MKTYSILLLLLFAMIFSNAELNAQKMPPIESGVSQTLAKWRAANYSDVRYKLDLTLEKKSPTLKGTAEISVNVSDTGGNPTVKEGAETQTPIILDWRKIKGHENLSTISNVELNGEPAKFEEKDEHFIFKDGVKAGENVIKLNFTSPILTSGSAITRYIDKEDGSEYIYSLFVPSDASTAFPVFDQPDLKARFQLSIKAPKEWNVISNAEKSSYTVTRCSPGANTFILDGIEVNSPFIKNAESTKSRQNDKSKETSMPDKIEFNFTETKPISTYVFAFAAGVFAEIEEKNVKGLESGYRPTERGIKPNTSTISYQQPSGGSPTLNGQGNISSKIYVRKSQAEKFKPHAKEVFRLNREAVKYFEDYFDYKFPFPKYDLVLIPEFPFGGMEHAGATFLRESSIIFPTEPTANDYISRASLIFHEAAHQWFGDTVTMKWFDDLWLKEGFATFMAYKAMEKLLPEYDIWKVFYERTKQRAYLTDITRGTTPIYQEIPNLSAAKSAYGNIVYQKAPSFLKQAEFYLGEKEFQTAVRAFLKKHEFANAEWSDLVDSFEKASGKDLKQWADVWVKQKGVPSFRIKWQNDMGARYGYHIRQRDFPNKSYWNQKFKILVKNEETSVILIQNFDEKITYKINQGEAANRLFDYNDKKTRELILGYPYPLIFPNYQDYGYGIFLLDEKSREYILKNIQKEKDSFLRAMMWGSLWDSVRFYELDPKDYVELVIKNIDVEKDVVTIASLLNRVSIAMTYYIESEPFADATGLTRQAENDAKNQKVSRRKLQPSATADGSDLSKKIEKLLLDKMKNAQSTEQKITFYRAFLNLASSDDSKKFLKDLLSGKTDLEDVDLKTKDKFDIVTKLIVLSDRDALKLLAELEKTEASDAAKRYAYAARAGIPTAENKAKYWNDFVNNKEISESWIEEAFEVWNTPRHSELTLPYLDKALAELPNLKRNRKIFFVNGWLSEFIGGQKSEEALNIVNKFLEDNPKLDEDLRRKILENVDGLERAVKIREKF